MNSAGNKSLETKLAAIRSGNYRPTDFIIADAKDADMSSGVQAPAPNRGQQIGSAGPGVYRTRQEYLADMRTMMAQGDVDIMLTSAANGEVLARDPETFGPVTLAVRGNDSTDIWNPRGSIYGAAPSQPFQSANLKNVSKYCDLVLYSLTFNNDVDADLRTLAAFKEFRQQASDLNIRYFLEVFNPNTPAGLSESSVGSFVNDSIVRALAGVNESERPLFLKVAFNGASHLKELTEHDSTLVVGLLGGSSGTTRDTFELLAQGEAAGARVALFGRKIQRAESQIDLVRLMRPVIEGSLTPAAAVEKYHEALMNQGIPAQRTLEDDQKVIEASLLGA